MNRSSPIKIVEFGVIEKGSEDSSEKVFCEKLIRRETEVGEEWLRMIPIKVQFFMGIGSEWLSENELDPMMREKARVEEVRVKDISGLEVDDEENMQPEGERELIQKERNSSWLRMTDLGRDESRL